MVTWSELAKADLRSIHDFIASNSPHYAKKIAQDLREKTVILERLPRIGNKIPELGDDDIRELSLHAYRIIYQIKGQDIVVLTVVHSRRNFDATGLGQ